jgi:hypothetical protein
LQLHVSIPDEHRAREDLSSTALSSNTIDGLLGTTCLYGA